MLDDHAYFLLLKAPVAHSHSTVNKSYKQRVFTKYRWYA